MKLSTLTLGAAVALALAGPALAGSAGDVSPGKIKDALITHYQTVEPTGTPTPTGDGRINTLGGAISGGFYGNTSNAGDNLDAPDRGHGVTPSISPGPQTVAGDGPGSGTSIGEFIQSLR